MIAKWVAFPERDPHDRALLVPTRHILNFRLTCKDFDFTALEAIKRLTQYGHRTAFEYAHLSLSHESLERLEQLAQHPMLQTAVTTLKLTLKPLDLIAVKRKLFATMNTFRSIEAMTTTSAKDDTAMGPSAVARRTQLYDDEGQGYIMFYHYGKRQIQFLVQLYTSQASQLSAVLDKLPNLVCFHFVRQRDPNLSRQLQNAPSDWQDHTMRLGPTVAWHVLKAHCRIVSIRIEDLEDVTFRRHLMPGRFDTASGFLANVVSIDMRLVPSQSHIINPWLGPMLSRILGLQVLVLVWNPLTPVDGSSQVANSFAPVGIMEGILGTRWDELHTVKFEGFVFHPYLLAGFLREHAKTLRTLRLSNFRLPHTEWPKVVEVVQGKLRLDEASLTNPFATFNQRFVDDLPKLCSPGCVSVGRGPGGLEVGRNSSNTEWVLTLTYTKVVSK